MLEELGEDWGKRWFQNGGASSARAALPGDRRPTRRACGAGGVLLDEACSALFQRGDRRVGDPPGLDADACQRAGGQLLRVTDQGRGVGERATDFGVLGSGSVSGLVARLVRARTSEGCGIRGLTAEQRKRREEVRMRAVDLFVEYGEVPGKVPELRVGEKSVYQWHRNWRTGGREVLCSIERDE